MAPIAMPSALPSGIDAFHRPMTAARFFSGNKAEITAVPPGANPDSPMPTTARTMKS